MQICTAASCRLCMRLLFLTWANIFGCVFFCESNAKCLKLNGNQLFDNFVAAALNLLRLLSVEKWNFTTISVIAWNQIACVEYFPCVDFPVSLFLSSYQYVPLQRRALLVIVDYIFTHRETHRQHLFGASAQTHMTDICWRTFNYFSLVSVWDEISYHLTLCINTITTKLFVLSISLSHIHTEIQNLHLSIYLLFVSLTVCVCVFLFLARRCTCTGTDFFIYKWATLYAPNEYWWIFLSYYLEGFWYRLSSLVDHQLYTLLANIVRMETVTFSLYANTTWNFL